MTDARAARLTSHLAPYREEYEENGFVVVRVFDAAETSELETFAVEWVRQLIARHANVKEDDLLALYHLWGEERSVPHDRLFGAANRHTRPPAAIETIVLNGRLRATACGLLESEVELWDEGLGWLAFRLIRPGMLDGYPMSCKAWGPAKQVLSCWIPIIGRSSSETIALVPGSHRERFDSYLPSEGKFRADEYRLASPIAEHRIVRPSLARGEVIFFHPRILHSEDVTASEITRLNLEMRFQPIHSSAS